MNFYLKLLVNPGYMFVEFFTWIWLFSIVYIKKQRKEDLLISPYVHSSVKKKIPPPPSRHCTLKEVKNGIFQKNVFIHIKKYDSICTQGINSNLSKKI